MGEGSNRDNQREGRRPSKVGPGRHYKDLGFSSERNGDFEIFEQYSDLARQKCHSGGCVENRVEQKGRHLQRL